MTILLIALIAIASILLMLVVLVQNPKGGGLGSSFGSGASTMFGGVKKTTDTMDKITWSLAGALLVLVLLFNMSNTPDVVQGAPDSNLSEEVEGAVMPQTTPAPGMGASAEEMPAEQE